MFTKQKREKPQQTIVTLKKKPEPSRRGKGNLFVKIAIIVFGVFVAVSVFNMQSEVANLKEEEATLTQQIAQYKNRIEELQADMLTPFDDTYRIRVAREKLGYCFTDETVYYNVISN